MIVALPVTRRWRARRVYDRAVKLHDSLTRQKVELPWPPGPVRMYVCGSTVYQRVHVGNSRPFVLAMWTSPLAAGDGL